MLNIFIEILNFLTLFFLCLGDLFNRRLDVLRVFRQFLEPLLQSNRFFLDDLAVLLVNFLQAHKLVLFVRVAEHGTLGADGHLARLAEVVEPLAVIFADFVAVAKQIAVGKCAIAC